MDQPSTINRSSPRDHRILIVTESIGRGGTESHLTRILPRLALKGWQLTVFCLSEAGDRASSLEDAGISVISTQPVATDERAPPSYAWQLISASSSLYKLMRHWQPKIAHFYLPRPYLVGAPIAMAARIPVKIMSRRSLSDYQQRWPGVRPIERLLHRQMDAVIANCRAVHKQLILEGVPEDKLHLIYNGLDADPNQLVDKETARQALGIDRNALVLLSIANLHAYKGHRDLIEGLAVVASSLPKHWHLLCAGSDGGVRSELEELVRNKGLADHVRLLGVSTRVDLLLAAADIGLLTPIGNEGFSNAILETMQAGVPMVVTDIGGNREAVLHGETGFVVPAHDPKSVGQAVLALSLDSELRSRFGERARRRVGEEFALEKWVQMQANLYDRLLCNQARRA